MNSLSEKLKDMKNIHAVCWKCKKELSVEETMTVTDGHSIIIDLCYSCYDYYKKISRA